jgi:7-cyano-7-deazaguanine synthase
VNDTINVPSTVSNGILVSLSGGLDSCVMMATLCSVNPEKGVVKTVSFYYGSKHGDYEEAAAINIAKHYGVPHRVIEMGAVLGKVKSALLKTDRRVIPEGHYEEESMRDTVVPGRNLIFIASLASIAESENLHAVYVGVHQGDHNIYPDCRPSFIAAANMAVWYSTENRVTLHAPFLTIDKAAIVKVGLENGAPFHLTRTCYKDQPVACGKCGSCQERLQAFHLNGAQDPIEYESRILLPK